LIPNYKLNFSLSFLFLPFFVFLFIPVQFLSFTFRLFLSSLPIFINIVTLPFTSILNFRKKEDFIHFENVGITDPSSPQDKEVEKEVVKEVEDEEKTGSCVCCVLCVVCCVG
jgi:hypothetical protein